MKLNYKELGVDRHHYNQLESSLKALASLPVSLPYKDGDGKYGFLTTPKVFADYRNFTKNQYGNNIVDKNYDYLSEIQRQMIILHKDSS